MLDNGITEESSSPYPLPRIDNTLDALNGSQWFSTLDLKNAYWQVEIRPEYREKTSFTTGQGLWEFKDSLHLKGGVLYSTWESDDGISFRWQLNLPRSRIPEVLRQTHESASEGYFGVMKILCRISERFYWDRLRTDVEKWCRKCQACGVRKRLKTRNKGILQRYNVGAPFKRIALDILRLFPVTTKGNRYVLVLMDYFAKWTEAILIPD
ncbi:hypothetical protein AVEN_161909-1 [Araneus ventricosus]|uniref:RNA-directed DNA polymerase n=1 Tax=Araneus ventricosus TaxID=182803 RepID=A0A4Y2L6T4_ARAVE|nr:hypothetical protein AVEN_161909-1 [Araneus ventricosus]